MTETIIARFTFLADRASEFIEQENQTIMELSLDDIDEVMEYADQFKDALTDVTALVNGQVISLADFTNEVE